MTMRREVARERLQRMSSFQVVRSDDGSSEEDGLTLEGHAAVFNVTTEINNWEGRFMEEVAPGAFRKSFRDRKPVLQFDHGSHPLLGSFPLGRFLDNTPREDDTGAFVRAKLFDNVFVQPVRDAIAEEAIAGMSFRFSVVKEEWRDEDGKLIRDEEQLWRLLYDRATEWPKRTLREVKVPELGPVVFPAYTETDVSVRSASGLQLDLVQLLSTESGKRSVARAMFEAEKATLGHSNRSVEPGETPLEGAEPEEPQARPALPEGKDTGPEPDRTVALAESMRARLTQLSRR